MMKTRSTPLILRPRPLLNISVRQRPLEQLSHCYSNEKGTKHQPSQTPSSLSIPPTSQQGSPPISRGNIEDFS
ncbi:hypothetical protein L873DRAFT_1820405 [Choiromyces venosus 120613-1]|uniref:Uncharacterized protein n=1 Tax=Choiromyces venosus 120613-1 TaxID=1336337 RepID=A0A3N4IY91_9PEZI|nr:hypothetical protein L873DRAFT_1820405 [Choiromyces venosus 120613-1]